MNIKIITIVLIFLGLFSSVYSIQADNDLRLDYRLYNNTLDFSGNGNDGTDVNVVTFNGSRASFDGFNSRFTTFDLDNQNDFTINVWINPVTINNNEFIMSCDVNTLNFHIDGITSGSNDYRIYTGASNSWQLGGDSGLFSTSTWNYLTITYEGTTLSMYHDGTLIKSTSTTFNGGSGDCKIGTRADTNTGRNFDGLMKNFNIWNRSLTGVEINDTKNNGITYVTSNIVSDLKPYSIFLINEIRLNSTENGNFSYILNGGVKTTIENNVNTTLFNLTFIETLNNVTWFSDTLSGEINISESILVDVTNPIIINNIPSTITNYEFNGSWFSCADANLFSCNISINGFNKATDLDFNLINNGNLLYNITAIDTAGNTVVNTGNLFVNPFANFYIYDELRLESVDNYSIGTYNSIGSLLQIPIYDIGLGSNELLFTKVGYVSKDIIFTFNDTSLFNETYNVSSVTLTMKMFEATTGIQIPFNITILNSTDSQVLLNQINLSLFYNDTLRGNLEFVVTSEGYSGASFYNVLIPSTAISINGYLFPTNLTNILEFTVQDRKDSAGLGQVLIELQALINGSYITLSQKETGDTGTTYFNANSNLEYQIVVSRSGYVTTVAQTIPDILTYIIKLEENTDAYVYVKDLSYALTPTSTLLFKDNNYTFAGFISGVSLTSIIYTLSWDNGSIIFTDSSINPSGTTLSTSLYIPRNLNNTFIRSNLSYITNGQRSNVIRDYSLTSFTNTSFMQSMSDFGESTDEDDRILRWLVIMIVSVAVIISGVSLGIPNVNLLIIPTLGAFVLVNWIPFTYAAVVMFISLVFYIGGRR